MKENYCIDCNKIISKLPTKRCASCAIKNCYKIGKLIIYKNPSHYCLDCKKELKRKKCPTKQGGNQK